MAQEIEGGCTSKRKRSKAYYGLKQAKRKKPGALEELSTGVWGILITTSDQEKLCVSEAYNLLNEYADKLYGPEAALGPKAKEREGEEGIGGEVIESEVAREVEMLKGKGGGEQLRRFQSCNSGAKHLVFIRCREPVEPCQLVHCMLSDLMDSGVQKSRFCQRIVPVTKVCYATMEDIEKQAESVLEPHFHKDDLQSFKFAITYKARNNNVIKRDEVIELLASMVTKHGDFPHTVDLGNPDLTVVVEIIKNHCCLSVVKDFHKLKKYNVQTIAEAAAQHSIRQLLSTAKKPSEQVQKVKEGTHSEDSGGVDKTELKKIAEDVASTQGECSGEGEVKHKRTVSENVDTSSGQY